jgi:DNA-binding FadR family transcriptional regulator
VNITDLLVGLQAQHDKTAARVSELRDQIEHLTAALAETEARLADLATIRKVIAELAPAHDDPEPPETNSV